VKKILYIM